MLHEAELLREAGHELTLLAIHNDEIKDFGLRKRLSLPLRAVWSPSTYTRISSAIQRLLPDVVHIHNTLPLASPSAFWAARSNGTAIVHTLANYRLMCPTATLFRSGAPCKDCVGRSVPWPGVLHACYRGSRAASATVAVMLSVHNGLQTWDRAVDLFMIASEFGRNRYIEAGIGADRILTKPITVPDPGQRRIGPGRDYLFTGRLSGEKGVDLLLEGWEASGLDPTRKLLIAGDGPDRQRLQAMARRRRLRGVHLIGALSKAEISQTLLSARALISPSLSYEVSSMSVIEGFAAGVPAILADGGAQAELVIPEVDGLLFRARDAIALGGALRRMEDDSLSERLGQGARKAYESRHSRQRVLEALEDGYDLALTRATGRREDRR